MKKILFSALVMGFMLFSCSDDPCKGIVCVNGDCVEGVCICEDGFQGADCSQVIDPCAGINCNNGTCVDGTCECDPGYTGEFCDKLAAEQFIGNWRGLFNKCFDEDTGFGNLADLLMVDIDEETELTITSDPNDNSKVVLEIEGFPLGGGGQALTGTIEGNQIILDEFSVDIMNFATTINGNASLSSDTMGVVTLNISIGGFINIDCMVDITKV